MRLYKEQRNGIFDAVASGNLDVTACVFVSKRRHIEVRHIPTGSRFRIFQTEPYGEHSDGQYGYRSSIGSDPESERESYFPWFDLLNEIRRWANRVSTWIDAPDFWKLQNNGRSFKDLPYEDTNNAPFTTAEHETISGQLTTIREYVKKTYSLTAEQVFRVDALFDEAKEASSRLGRKDWILLFGGAIFSLILTDAITPDIAQHILMMAVHGLEHLFSSNPRPLGHAELIEIPMSYDIAVS